MERQGEKNDVNLVLNNICLQADSCDTGLESSGASQDIRPPLVFKKYKKSNINGDEESDTELTNGEENYMVKKILLGMMYDCNTYCCSLTHV